MIKTSKIQVFNFEGAIRGMRNPMNSWGKSDSYFVSKEFCEDERSLLLAVTCGGTAPLIGENDLALMKKLAKAGTEHRKYLREIFVSLDIEAPLYWWKEFDTYKVGTTANSCSTMHKIHSKEFTFDDFSHEHILDYELPKEDGCVIWNDCGDMLLTPMDILAYTIAMLNVARSKFLETKDKKYWWQMIQLLPSSYNQKRTVTMTYENVLAMIRQRENHKLDEWRTLVEIFKTLPYIEELVDG